MKDAGNNLRSILSQEGILHHDNWFHKNRVHVEIYEDPKVRNSRQKLKWWHMLTDEPYKHFDLIKKEMILT